MFAWILGNQEDEAPLRRLAELGFAFAQARLADQTQARREIFKERFKFAQLAAAQGECEGFFLLGWCFHDGEGCEMDFDKAKEKFLLASELGHAWAMNLLGILLEESDPQRWRWWGQAAALGDSWSFLFNFEDQVEFFNSGSGSAAVMFAVGRALQGHVNEEEGRTIFNEKHDFDSRIGPAKQAIAFYDAQIKATKDAMRAWTLVGIRYNLVKDVRKLIAKLIWDLRQEALYDVSKRPEQEEEEEREEQEPQPSARALLAQKRARK